jgi:hypothetical protein
MNLENLVEWSCHKDKFTSLEEYIAFCRDFLEYVSSDIQADIVSRNEPHYHFLQFKEEGLYNVTRPINYKLMYSKKEAKAAFNRLLRIVSDPRARDTKENRGILSTDLSTPSNNRLGQRLTHFQRACPTKPGR